MGGSNPLGATNIKKYKIMVILLVQLGLMGLNLYAAKVQQDNGKNPGFQYFVAGVCFMGAISAIVKLVV